MAPEFMFNALLADARVTVRRLVLEDAAVEAEAATATLTEQFPNTAQEISESMQFAFRHGLSRPGYVPETNSTDPRPKPG